MGIRSSRPVDDFAELIHNAKNQPGEAEQSYTKARIEEGLKVVADHLLSKGLDVSIVTVGGAVNTVLLKSRASTGDVDFFYRTKDSQSEGSKIMSEVVKGGELAEQKLGLGKQWLNNHTVVFMEEGTMNDLYAEAIQQNDKVFSAKGLTVYAAPWNYALVTKLDRAGKPGAKVYDMTDAVDYLGRLINTRSGHAVKRSELKAWTQQYKFAAPTEAVIDRLAKDYRAKHGKDGVVND